MAAFKAALESGEIHAQMTALSSITSSATGVAAKIWSTVSKDAAVKSLPNSLSSITLTPLTPLTTWDAYVSGLKVAQFVDGKVGVATLGAGDFVYVPIIVESYGSVSFTTFTIYVKIKVKAN